MGGGELSVVSGEARRTNLFVVVYNRIPYRACREPPERLTISRGRRYKVEPYRWS